MSDRYWHIADDWLQRDGYTLLSQIKDVDGRKVVRFEQTVEPIEDGIYVGSDVGILLTGNDAQQIMNELWRVGVRPKDGSGAVAHTDSLKAHLADMKTIAFHSLKIPND